MFVIDTPAPKGNQTPRWIMSTRDLPQSREPKTFVIDGKKVTLQKRWRQVLDALLIGPIFCASPVRLSDACHVLRMDYGVQIVTEAQADGRRFYPLASVVDTTTNEVVS